MAYRAEIEIVAKGVAKIGQLQKNLNQLANQIDHLNGPGSLGDFNKQLAQATKLMNRAQQGTVEEKRAIEQYVVALNNANQAQARTNKLIAEEIRQRNGATIALRKYNAAAVPPREKGSMSGRYLRPLGRSQSAVSLGPQPDRTKMLRRQAVLDRTVRRTQQLSGLQQGLAKLSKVEADARLDAARSASQQVGEMAAISREAKKINQYSLPRVGPREPKADRRSRSSGGRSGRQRFTDIATGAGFPLLFGGGPLQALAGGVGGAFGGLGGAIAGSAIVAQVEAFATAAAQTGVALTSTSGALELMREKSLFSSEAAKERAAVLEELGQVEELAAHLGQEMANAIGNNGVKALQDLGDTTKETTRLWNLLTTQLFRLVAGPLNDFLKIVNDVLGGITTEQQFRARKKDLGAEGGAALEARVAELVAGDTSRLTPEQLRSGKGRGVGALSRQAAMKQALGEKQFQVAATPIPVTAQDRRDITAGAAGRRSRIPDLNAEIGLQERLLTLNNQIAQAKRDENPVREAALQMEVAMEEQAAKRAVIDAKRIPEAEKILEKQLLELQTDQKILEIQNRLRDIRAAKAEKVADTVTALENEGALLQAKLDGNETEVELKQKIAEATKDMSATDAKRVEDLIRGNALLKEQIDIADGMKRVYEQIGMSIKTGVVDAITAAVDGTKSLAEVASNTLQNIAKQLLNIGVNFALFGVPFGPGKGGGLLGGFFANGGRPPVGKPSVVGERGPELFVPRSSGTIVPNHALGGSANVTVNVDASGSSVQGDGPSANQLGKAIGAAVQAELIKQKRPGGLLTR